MNKRNLFFILSLLIFLFTIISIAQAKMYHAMVKTKDGMSIKGLLLKFSPDEIQLDPDGPVTFRVFKKEEIHSLYIIELNKEFFFPVEEGQLPDELKNYQKTSKHDPVGFPSLSISAAIGSVSLDSENNGSAYGDFNSGTSLHLGFRYYFYDNNPYASRFFVGCSYWHSSWSDGNAGYYFSNYKNYYAGYLKPEQMRIHHYGLEFGITSRSFAKDCYVYVLGGIALLSQKLRLVKEDYFIKDNLSVSDNQTAFRCNLGGVLGLTPRIGLELTFGADFIIWDVQENNWGQEEMAFSGWLPNFAVGICYDF